MTKKAAIVGSGVAGLAAAIRLQVMGYQVDVFEANDSTGGKIASIEVEGFRFDTGPAVITDPQSINELFILAGKDIKDYIEFKRLSPEAKYLYEDGTTITAYAELIKLAEEIAAKTGENKEKVRQYLVKGKQWLQRAKPFMTSERDLSVDTLASLDGLDVIAILSQPDIYRSVAKSTQLFADKRVQMLFNHFATYAGSDPNKAPAASNVLPYLEFTHGAYAPTKGTTQIADSLTKLATDIGVKFHFGIKVDAILFDKKKAWGIGISGNEQLYDVVVSNTDVVHTYRQLLRALDEPKELSRPLSHSAMIFYWGIGKLHPDLEVKNIFFAADTDEEYRHLYDLNTLYDYPTIQLTITSKYNPNDAPVGAENWMVMVNVPNNSGQDWKSMRKQMEGIVLAKLSRMLGEDISKWIIADETWDPLTLEEKSSAYKGALYGSSGNSISGVFNRHRNYHSHLTGLYFCGGTVHPGPGIANCLQSAKIVANLVNKWEE